MGNVSRRDAIARALGLAGIGLGTVLGFAGLASPAPTKLPSNSVSGSGTSPFLAKWTAAQTIGASIFQDDGVSLKGTTDNSQDLGTSTLKYRDGHFGRSVGIGLAALSTQPCRIQGSSSNILAVMRSTGRVWYTGVNLGSGSGRYTVGNTSDGDYWYTDPADGSAPGSYYPGGDNAQDLGKSASNRLRHGYFAGQVRARSKNVVVVENLDETQASAAVPNTDTDLKTYVLPANAYTHVIVEAEGYDSFTTLSTNQDISLKIKDGSTQVGQTMKVDAALSATSKIPFSLKASFVDTAGATLHITHSAPAADANTTTFLNSMRVYGES